MPTETAKSQARSTQRQAKATKNQAVQTARTAEKTVERAGRTFTTVLIDSAYASIGATDSAIAWLRSLPNTFVRVSSEAPGLTETLQREFDSLAVRGRQVVDAIATSPTTQRAVEQTRTARHQFRTAAGQVRKTAQVAEDAVEETAQATKAAGKTVGSTEQR
jgi:hypothetical protein